MSRRRVLELPWMHGEEEYLVDVRMTEGDPGYTSGPPERCYPPEPDEMEVLSIHVEATGEARNDLIPFAQADDELYEDARGAFWRALEP